MNDGIVPWQSHLSFGVPPCFQREERIFAESVLEEKLKTGDAILFSGNSLSSKAICFVHASPWSHVGMVISGQSDEGPWLLESSRSGGYEKTGGVTLLPLRWVLKTYDGKVYVRRIQPKLQPDQVYMLYQFARENLYKPFSFDMRVMLKSFLNHWGRRLGINLVETYKNNAYVKTPKSKFFCSQFIAEGYGIVGMPPFVTENPDNMLPFDFSEVMCESRNMGDEEKVYDEEEGYDITDI